MDINPLFASFDDLLREAEKVRRKSKPQKEKIPWCWFYDYSPYSRVCRVGYRFKGYFPVSVIGRLHPFVVPAASEFVRRLNEQDGISEQTVSEVERSFEKRATVRLTENGEHVCLRFWGVPVGWDELDNTDEPWSIRPSEGTGVLGAQVELDDLLCMDIREHLLLLDRRGKLPSPEVDRGDVSAFRCESTGLTVIEVGGLLGEPTSEGGDMRLAISLQTASNLLNSLLSIKFWD